MSQTTMSQTITQAITNQGQVELTENENEFVVKGNGRITRFNKTNPEAHDLASTWADYLISYDYVADLVSDRVHDLLGDKDMMSVPISLLEQISSDSLEVAIYLKGVINVREFLQILQEDEIKKGK